MSMKNLIKNKVSLREKPICPIGELTWKKYYWVYPRKQQSYESKYWGIREDPDGEKRNLIDEWKQQVKNLKHITDFLKEVKPGKILDVGCGPGFLLSTLNKRWDKYGIDVSKTALEHCSKYAKVFHGELPKLKFKKNMFDVVVMNHVIEHLPDPVEYLFEVKKILKENGILIIATPDFDSGCARHFGKRYRMLHDKGHISLFTSFSLVKMLEDYKFEIIFVDYPFFDTIYFTKKNLERLADARRTSPPFYGNHVVVYSMNKEGRN